MPVDGNTAMARLWSTGAPVRLDDYDGVAGAAADVLRAYGVGAVVAAPITLGGRLWGAVVVSNVDPEPFPPGTEQRIANFAELAAQALANANARERAGRLARPHRRRPATPSAAGWSATCTTARSSGSSRSR